MRIIAVVIAVVMSVSALAAVPSVDAQAATGRVTKVTVTNLRVSSTKNGCDYYCKTLKKGKSFTIKAKVSGTTSNKKVTYKVINGKNIVSVSKSGKIKAKKKGTAVIKVTSKANSKKYCKVKVTVGTPAKSMKVSAKTASVAKNKTISLTARITNKASNKKIKFSVSNKKVAKVVSKTYKNGKYTVKVKGLKVGTCNIKAIAADGSGVCKTIKVTVAGVGQMTERKTVKAGSSFRLNATCCDPATIVEWNSSSKYVTVDDYDGSLADKAGNPQAEVTIKAGVSGNVTITAVDEYGNKSVFTLNFSKKVTASNEVSLQIVTKNTEHQHDWVAQYEERYTALDRGEEFHWYCGQCGKCTDDDPDHTATCGEYYYSEIGGGWIYAGAHDIGHTTYYDDGKTEKVLIGYKCSKCLTPKECKEKVVETTYDSSYTPVTEITTDVSEVKLKSGESAYVTVRKNSDASSSPLVYVSDNHKIATATIYYGDDHGWTPGLRWTHAVYHTGTIQIIASGAMTGTTFVTIKSQNCKGEDVSKIIKVTVTE